MRHNRIQPLLQHGCVALRMRFFSQNFGTIKRILPESSSPSHREGPGTEVDVHQRTHARFIAHYISALVRTVLTAIQREYWIFQGRSRIRWIIDKCLRSRKMYASPYEQIMAPLPTPCVTACENPFASTGVDYFGPLMVKRGRSMVKRYGCVFTCMAIRAVHIEIAHSSPSCVPLVVLRRVEASQLIGTLRY